MGFARVFLVYQPHTYSRTAAFFDEFTTALSHADAVILTDIYAARETDDMGVSGQKIAQAITGGRYIADWHMIAETLRAEAREGDLILTMGAGDVYKIGEMLV
jgi:UDP-N-acetylmuramate--alanine ligase